MRSDVGGLGAARALSVGVLAAWTLAGACTVTEPLVDGGPGADGGRDAPRSDTGPPIECLRTYEYDTDLSTPAYDSRTTLTVDQAGRPLRGETRAADGSLISRSTFTVEGNATLEEKDLGGDGTIDRRERMTREFDAMERVLRLTIDRNDDGFVDATLDYTYGGASRIPTRFDQVETFMGMPSITTFALFTEDAMGRFATEELHLSTGVIDRARFVYDGPGSAVHLVTLLDRGSDGTDDIRLRIDFDEGCELEIGPEEILY